MYAALLAENATLKSKVAELEARLQHLETKAPVESYSNAPFPDFPKSPIAPLSKVEVERYGRQLIMREIGASGTCNMPLKVCFGLGGFHSTLRRDLTSVGTLKILPVLCCCFRPKKVDC